MYKQLAVYKDETSCKSLPINLTRFSFFLSKVEKVKIYIIFIKNAAVNKKMPRQYSFLKIVLNYSVKLQVFDIILLSDKVRRGEGGSFNPRPTKSKNLRDQNTNVEIGSGLSWSYNKILSQNKISKPELAIN